MFRLLCAAQRPVWRCPASADIGRRWLAREQSASSDAVTPTWRAHLVDNIAWFCVGYLNAALLALLGCYLVEWH
jgi:hypothetical protein